MPLTSSFWYISEFNVGISYSAIIYISSFILLLLIFTILMSVSFSKRASMEVVIEKFDVKRLINFQKKLTYIWLLIFVAEVIYSGGLPILWSNKGFPLEKSKFPAQQKQKFLNQKISLMDGR